MQKKCSRCGSTADCEVFERRATYHTKNGQVYKSHYTFYKAGPGEPMWRDNLCGSCLKNTSRKTKGTIPRELNPIPFIKKAVDAERAAAEKFEQMGFEVKRTDCFGPDLLCSIGPLTWTVEVKSVTETKIKDRSYYVTGRVSRRRREDDLVAIVLPNGHVLIDSMPLHLAACNNGGGRSVTKIVRAFDKFNV